MQRPTTTDVVTPNGRIINSCTVDYQTVYLMSRKTHINKLTLESCLSHISNYMKRWASNHYPTQCAKHRKDLIVKSHCESNTCNIPAGFQVRAYSEVSH
jgi:hypothetical protein